MPVAMNIEQITAHLERIREANGEVAFQQARRDLALSVVLQPNGDKFIANAFPDLNIEELKQEAQAKATADPTSPEQVMMKHLQQQVPSITTQGHLNLFMAAFDALRTTMDGYFSGNPEKAAKARQVLDRTLDTAAKVKETFEKLSEMAPEERSAQANEFLGQPKQFHEYDTQKRLLLELGGQVSVSALGRWYAETKEQRDNIVSTKLRNELIDSIRKKRMDLAAKEAS